MLKISDIWSPLSQIPGGKWVFSRLLGFWVPYSGTIKPRILELTPGYAKVQITDRRGIRQHLKSIHAVALTNLGELTSGLALISGLPEDTRGIVTGISIQYFKKARGVITAESKCSLPKTNQEQNFEVVATLRDEEGDTVAQLKADWKIGPKVKREN